jgi:DNA-directed RNA polymerase II subunit RPB2
MDPDALQNKDIVKVFVNGNWYGIHRDADSLTKEIKKMRRSYTIPKEISIIRDINTREIKIFTDSGRV